MAGSNKQLLLHALLNVSYSFYAIKALSEQQQGSLSSVLLWCHSPPISLNLDFATNDGLSQRRSFCFAELGPQICTRKVIYGSFRSIVSTTH